MRQSRPRRLIMRAAVAMVVAGTFVLTAPTAIADSKASIPGSDVKFLSEFRRFVVNDTACDDFHPYAKFHWQRPGEQRSATERAFFFSTGSDKPRCKGPRFIDVGGGGPDVPSTGDLTVVYRACIAKPGKGPCSAKQSEKVT